MKERSDVGVELLERIADVVAARVVTDEEGNPGAVYVLAGPGRPAEAIKNDVVTALLARYGAAGDVHLVQLTQGPEERGWRLGDLRLVGFRLHRRGWEAEAQVEVKVDQVVYTGTAVGPVSRANRRRLLARATLAAATQGLPGMREWEVEGVAVADVAGYEVVIVITSVLGPDDEKILAGSALIDRDEGEAVCRATLDLVRRWLEI